MSSPSIVKRVVVLCLASLILVALRRQASLLDTSLSLWSFDDDGAEDTPANLPRSSTSNSLLLHKGDTEPARRKWAYAFVVGGCSSSRPEYRGFIWNIAVAAQVLQDAGSKADVIALIQMSARTNETELPEDETKLLEAMNVKIEYIPKFSSMIHEVFYTLMLEKFRILQMTQYSRVIFMDGDVMPLCSLDYIFELSEPESGEPVLKDNVVISYSNQPAHGGFFMLHPQVGDYEEIQKIIKATEEKADSLPPFEHWDEVEGWGHKIESPDQWLSSIAKYTSTNWTWHGVHADQGLLYHWTKYVKKSVTLIIKYQVQNWGRAANGSSVMEKAFMNFQPNAPINAVSCLGGGPKINAPYTDFRHFTGRGKPWQQNHTHYRAPTSKNREEVTNNFDRLVSSLNEEVGNKNQEIDSEKLLSVLKQMVPFEEKEAKAPVHNEKGNMLSYSDEAYVKWFIAFDKIQRVSGVNITLTRYMGRFQRSPPVGTFPKYKERIKHIRWKMKHGWNPYEETKAQ